MYMILYMISISLTYIYIFTQLSIKEEQKVFPTSMQKKRKYTVITCTEAELHEEDQNHSI